jgi:C4-dicarboxylate-binding protein DctP
MAVAQSAGELDFALINFGDVAAAVNVPEYEIACRVPTFGVDWKDLLSAYDDFWDDPAGGGVVGAIFEKQGIKILGTHTSGFITLSCSEPVVTADEWSGKKIRYPGGAVAENIILAVGATPVQIPWSEAQMALKTGVADGIITDSAYFRYRLWELGPKYLSNVCPLAYLRELAVSTKTLDKMPADIRQALEGMVPEFNSWCKEWNIAFTDKVVSDTEPFFERYELTDAAFKAASEKLDAAMLSQFEEINPDLLAVWQKVISKYQ